ncbi:hypothetical protein FGK63_15665 [Ruegeria sediminis]|uniref:Uncharacterized protein n=1 Tax=Ruegeria sediminis TaxID=2583820 RepID=A0ABY2WUT2_9RHOB|nr:hypothetical protein [Ruegeria sediminis]TMV05486.1 hypothetical protein FGK63_15665 [Ruegeria sediminis]
MQITRTLAGTAVVLALSTTASLAASETAECKLTNVSADTVLYEGTCQVSQEQSGSNTIYSVSMPGAESFMFAGSGDQWMHGSDKVQFTDLPNGGIFKWGDFALAVAE